MSVPTAVLHPVSVEPTHAWLMTLQRPVGNGLATFTSNGTYTAKPGATREDAYRDIRAWLNQQRPEMADACVLFFSLEPNRL
ncbi:hypothetical protein [Streptomyces sp. NRRL S-350]|uniref:hypothetical protein n=1 Tax=Streptomyces sp. NRRL S-350 TaxID=1463902 RepID=UPI0004BF0957|nr:hypothetical protein [Streptomyces sp. NRRL S-350]